MACGHYGTGIGVYYSSAQTAHYRCRSRLDQTHTPRCRSVSAALVDPIVERRLLEIVTTDQIALSVATEAALAAQSAQQPQLPNTSNLEALAADLRRL